MVRVAAEYILKKDIADRNKDTDEQSTEIKAKEEGKGSARQEDRRWKKHEERIR